MLKKSLITLSLSSILFATTAVAQGSHEGTYACQYVDANGFIYEDGRWQRTGFNLMPHFFIKLGPDTLDPQSILDGLEVGFSATLPLCFPVDVRGAYTCTSHVGEAAIFNPVTREGAKTTILGASGVGEIRDTLSISTFVCQKV